MIVYADVLIVLNLFVNFFILKITAKLCREDPHFGRIILGAFLGGIFSLYIFLPPSGMLLESLFRLTISGLIILTAFGFDSIKSFLRRVGVFFCASFLYAGSMLGLWTVLKLDRVAINNGIVYIDISPLILILSTLVCYMIISVIRYFSKKQAYNGKRCRLHISYNGRNVTLTALVDTGHSLTDSLTEREVIIVEQGIAIKLLGFLPTLQTVTAGGNSPKGFRIIPYSSVGGHGLLPAFVPDKICFEANKKIHEIGNTLIAVSNEILVEDYKAIISPSTLDIK